MLASPLASTTGWTWSQDAIADLPNELRGAFPSTAGTAPAPGVRKPEVKPEGVIGVGRLLEPGGRPVSGRQVTLERPVGAVSANLLPEHRGNVLAALNLTRAALGAGTRLRASAASEEVALATAAGRAPAAGLDLSSQPAHLDIAALDDWFGPQGSAALQRFSRGNTVTPYVNGPAFFDVLFRELHAYTQHSATPPAFYLAGFAIDHSTNFVPPAWRTARCRTWPSSSPRTAARRVSWRCSSCSWIRTSSRRSRTAP